MNNYIYLNLSTIEYWQKVRQSDLILEQQNVIMKNIINKYSFYTNDICERFKEWAKSDI